MAPLRRAATPVAIFLILLLPLTAAEPNPEQRGHNGTCADFNALYLTPELQLDAISIQGGTRYNASHQGGKALYIDFYDTAGNLIGDNARNPKKSPADAVTATFCVGQLGGGWPDLPAPDAIWVYQDGL